MLKVLMLLVLSAAACPASLLYDNSTTDQLFSVFYSTGYIEIGDTLALTSPGYVTSLEAQFFNAGSDATFDAVVSFYRAGAPLGSLLGGPFTVTGISISSLASQTVTFTGFGSLLVPIDTVVLLAVQNVSAGGDIGVNFFDPPTAGTSDATYFLANDGSGAVQTSTYLDIDNVYLRINGTPVPEPSTAGLTVVLLAGLVYCQRRRSRRA